MMEDARVSGAAGLRAFNRTRSTVLCEQVEEAGGMRGKSRGLLGRDGLAPGTGMLFEAGSIEPFMCMHMFFMRFAIDIVFLDRAGRVMRISHNLKPWRLSPIVWGARKALELPSGSAEQTRTEVGDEIALESS
jgi:hypothetical protein